MSVETPAGMTPIDRPRRRHPGYVAVVAFHGPLASGRVQTFWRLLLECGHELPRHPSWAGRENGPPRSVRRCPECARGR